MLKLFTFVQVAADSLRRREEGQTMAEYGVVLAVITLAVIGAVIGEFVGSSEGLGFLLLTATSQLDTPLAFAALFALSILGVLVYLLVEAIEWLIAPWLPPAPERH